MDDDYVVDHKLCGFFLAVLRPNSPCQALALPARCSLFADVSDVGFKTDDGLVLSVIDDSKRRLKEKPGSPASEETSPLRGQFGRCESSLRKEALGGYAASPDCHKAGNCEGFEGERVDGSIAKAQVAVDVEFTKSGISETPERKCGGSSGSGSSSICSVRKARRIGFVNGSMSIVHQIHTLVRAKCLNVVARVVGLMEDDQGEARAVVLVDVYLPLAVLSGWQFPHHGSVAGALFRHLRCDWGERSQLLGNGQYSDDACADGKSRWNLPDCHVLGCSLHTVVPDSSKKRLFDLHEIFKNLPSLAKKENLCGSSRIKPADTSYSSGIWDLPDDVMLGILRVLCPLDLVRTAVACRHLRSLAASIMPCMNLRLFPHQQAAVEWMLQRERNAEVMLHPLYKEILTEDGFLFYVNLVSGEVISDRAPTVTDFHGGMFCDEPGLGKTITALSLILKTQGTLADPPDGEQVIWCIHNGDQKCGYYEFKGDYIIGINGFSSRKVGAQNTRRGKSSIFSISPSNDVMSPSPKRARMMAPDQQFADINDLCLDTGIKSPAVVCSKAVECVTGYSGRQNSICRNFSSYEVHKALNEEDSCGQNSSEAKYALEPGASSSSPRKADGISSLQPHNLKRTANLSLRSSICNETWIQCDSCQKWRKVAESYAANAGTTWFCSMNADSMYQSCDMPEECWDNHQLITDLRGFFPKGTLGWKEENIEFFKRVLKDHYAFIDSYTRKALNWLAMLSPDKLSEMETIGLRSPCTVSVEDASGFHRIFESFGLLKRVEKGVSRWYYPRNLKNLEFDVRALKAALSEPLNSVRLFLSRATLIVVPANLVDHWKTQIEKHVRPSQLKIYVLTDRRKISAHNLAWDYDIVITTFNRLSAEWAPHKNSVLKQVHWLRIMLDEGHTLGSSLNLTNKLQMAISLRASSRWILTGTPTPNTPSSQLSHLQIMLRFLHEEAYGLDQKSWDTGILRPFDAEMEEGRLRLLNLFSRCMISARKKDLLAIPPCMRKVTFVNFTEQHAKSYNELVVTVRRNILMADWNDPSHIESLLNPKQWKFRGTTIRNVRLSCCVAGHIKVTNAGEDIQETMDMLLQKGLDARSEEYALLKYILLNGGACFRCQEWCRLPVITPCRHLLCLDCVALNRERCTIPGCGYSYEMETLEARPENPNPKWPVPKDLIELQPSYKQDDWDPDWQSTSSSKVAYLVEKLKKLQGATKRISSNDEHNNLNFREQATPSCVNIPKLVTRCGDDSISATEAEKITTEKVIIFSQFLEHIHVIEQQLMLAGIEFAGMYSPMHSSNKMKALSRFQRDPKCMALLMDGSAALGLDLSFVTHVFLMEPIWDKSMEEQVISRAHRMGATRPIYVETLAMCGTIEQQMLDFLQDADSCRRFLKEEVHKPDREGARAHRTLHDFAGSNYLSQLQCVRTNSNT